MISRIQGIVIEKQPPLVLIDISGIAYEVNLSMNTFYKLPDLGQKATLHTHLIIREDAHLLYGFYDQAERGLFRALIKVNGVGPKLALTILSSVTPTEFIHFVTNNNSLALIRLPGIGKKTAERLIIEMRDKLKDIDFTSHSMSSEIADLSLSLQNTPEQEATSALIALGYKPQEASKAIARIDIKDLNSQEIIRRALQGMVN